MVEKATPFVSWAGGKRKLLKEIHEILPSKIDRYYEPFVGGGAVFFYVAQKFDVEMSYISDINENLMTCYDVIKYNPESLIKQLEKIINYPITSELYYKIREENINCSVSPIKASARFIFLNKTAFNSLWRVNSSGKFNVPWNKKEKPGIYSAENIKSVSDVLQNTEIECSNFEDVLENIPQMENTFVYLDPPYIPVSKTSFTSHSKHGFSIEDHYKLADLCQQLDKKGIKFAASNSYTEKSLDIWSDFNIKMVMAGRSINSDPNGRGKVKEIIVTNY